MSLFCDDDVLIRKLTNETHIRSCLTHLITKTTTAKRCLKKQSREYLVPSKVCKTSYAMYTRENFEYCWGSWFGSYSQYSLYSIFTNALKQARQIQRDDCDEVYDEDDCNDDNDVWAKDCGFGMF